ncbi:MAG: hypothetical protein QOI43_1351 [Gaiellales bacterium]|nr:hypothetical protein [Gaiellales bacterium]
MVELAVRAGGLPAPTRSSLGVSSQRMSRQMPGDVEPLAVVFHEKDRSPVTGLRFGLVEVLLADDAPVRRGFLPRIGAEAVARELGVPLLYDSRFH